MQRNVSFIRKIKQLTKRNGVIFLAEAVKRLNLVVRGFVNCFSIDNCKRDLKAHGRLDQAKIKGNTAEIVAKAIMITSTIKTVKV